MLEKICKVCLVGEKEAGKSAFLERYIKDSFNEEYTRTIGVDFARKTLSGSQNIALQFWDCSPITSLITYYRGARIFVIVVAANKLNQEKKDEISRYHSGIKETMSEGSEYQIIIIETKTDLPATELLGEKVELPTGQTYPVIAVSAKTGINFSAFDNKLCEIASKCMSSSDNLIRHKEAAGGDAKPLFATGQQSRVEFALVRVIGDGHQYNESKTSLKYRYYKNAYSALTAANNSSFTNLTIIRCALADYSKAYMGSRKMAAFARFFSGQWNNHFGDAVTKLLLKPEYEKFTSEAVLERFVVELAQSAGTGSLNPKGDLFAIFSLANDLTGVNCIEKFKQAFAIRNSVSPSFS